MSKKRKIYKSKRSVKAMFREMEKERKKHPIRTWLRPKFWQLIRLPREIRQSVVAFYQRGKRGYANRDVWGLCYYLSDVISKSVSYLRDHNMGYPNDLTPGKWIDILDEIRLTFETARCLVDGTLYLIEDKKDRKKWEVTLQKINKDNDTYDRCMSDKEIKAYKEGWRKFQFYFLNLWD